MEYFLLLLSTAQAQVQVEDMDALVERENQLKKLEVSNSGNMEDDVKATNTFSFRYFMKYSKQEKYRSLKGSLLLFNFKWLWCFY